jgi:hypothetical protein
MGIGDGAEDGNGGGSGGGGQKKYGSSKPRVAPKPVKFDKVARPFSAALALALCCTVLTEAVFLPVVCP